MATANDNHGRAAHGPFQINFKGWIDIFWRLKQELRRDNLTLISAGLAFYTLLAIFPGIVALISIWGILFEPEDMLSFIAQFRPMMPGDAFSILEKQALDIAGQPHQTLTLSLIAGIALAAFGASSGVKSLIKGLNIVYEQREERGFFRLNLLAVGLTMFLVVTVIVSLMVIIAVPELLAYVLPQTILNWWQWLRWVVLFFSANFTLAVLYRYGPCRNDAQWQWLGIGSVIATLLWLTASAGFSFYVQHFGRYNETYGSIGAVIVLLMWFWLSALTVLLGAELNAEIEHQTSKDSTVGPAKPMGKRGATMADTLGKART